MPQMAPIMWLPLLILIVCLLAMVKSIVYFTKNNKVSSLNTESTSLTLNWSW